MASALLAPGPQAAEFHLEHPNAESIPALDADTKADVGDFLVVSPYTSQPHLLDLRSYQEPQRLLARALTVLEPVRVDYATAQYDRSFNWNAVVDHLRFLSKRVGHAWTRQDFYIVVFRSQVIPTTDSVELGGLDQNSHAEANRSGGLLKYWFGMPDENGRNLATCMQTHAFAQCYTLGMERKVDNANRHMAQARGRRTGERWTGTQSSCESDSQYVL